MRLRTNCRGCHQPIALKGRAKTRPDLQKKIGDFAKLQCPNCARRDERHVNDIYAQVSPPVVLIGLFLGIAFTLFLWQFYGGISTLSFIIPLLFWQQEEAAVKTFNGYRVFRKD